MRAPEQRWQTPERAASYSPGLGTANTDVARLLDTARNSLTPLDEFLDRHTARAEAAGTTGGVFAGVPERTAPLAVAGPAHAPLDQWRPPLQYGAAADALTLQSADAALLASASRRAYPHTGAATGQGSLAHPFGVPRSPAAPDFGRPPSRSQEDSGYQRVSVSSTSSCSSSGEAQHSGINSRQAYLCQACGVDASTYEGLLRHQSTKRHQQQLAISRQQAAWRSHDQLDEAMALPQGHWDADNGGRLGQQQQHQRQPHDQQRPHQQQHQRGEGGGQRPHAAHGGASVSSASLPPTPPNLDRSPKCGGGGGGGGCSTGPTASNLAQRLGGYPGGIIGRRLRSDTSSQSSSTGRQSVPRVRIAPNDGRGYNSWEQSTDDGMHEQPHGGVGDLERDAQLQHAVVLGGGMPLEDGLEALAARYYCQVCGVATTSETNLQDHMRGKKHQRRMARAGLEGVLPPPQGTMSTALSHSSGSTPPPRAPTPPSRPGSAALPPSGGWLSMSGASRSVSRVPSLQRINSLQRVPSGVLNRGEAAALAGGLQRMPSGNIYDGFPCIRVGDFVLPSSMDLRKYLDEVQEIGELSPHPAQRVGALLRAASLAASQAAAAADMVASSMAMAYDEDGRESSVGSGSPRRSRHSFSTPGSRCASRQGSRPPSPRKYSQPPSPRKRSSSRPTSAVSAPPAAPAVADEADSSAQQAAGGSSYAAGGTQAGSVQAATAGEAAQATQRARSAPAQAAEVAPVADAVSGAVAPAAGVEAAAAAAQPPADMEAVMDSAIAEVAAAAQKELAGASGGSNAPQAAAELDEQAAEGVPAAFAAEADGDAGDAAAEQGPEQAPDAASLRGATVRRQLTYAQAATQAHSPPAKDMLAQLQQEAVSPDSRRSKSAALAVVEPPADASAGGSGDMEQAVGGTDAVSAAPEAETDAADSEKAPAFGTGSDSSSPQPVAAVEAAVSADAAPAADAEPAAQPVAEPVPDDAAPASEGAAADASNTPAKPGLDSGGEDGEVFCCELCDVTTSSRAHLEAHFQGKRHQRRLGEGGGGGGGLQACALCRVTTTSAEHMALHLAGRAHQRKLRILAVQRRKAPQAGLDTDSEAGGDGGASAAEAAATAVGAGLVYVCRTCGITTTSPENLQAHFDGAQHKKKLRQQQTQADARRQQQAQQQQQQQQQQQAQQQQQQHMQLQRRASQQHLQLYGRPPSQQAHHMVAPLHGMAAPMQQHASGGGTFFQHPQQMAPPVGMQAQAVHFMQPTHGMAFASPAGAGPGVAVQMYGQPAQWGYLPQRLLPAAALQQQQFLAAAGQQLQPPPQQQMQQQFGGGGIAAGQLLHFNANPHFGNGLMH